MNANIVNSKGKGNYERGGRQFLITLSWRGLYAINPLFYYQNCEDIFSKKWKKGTIAYIRIEVLSLWQPHIQLTEREPEVIRHLGQTKFWITRSLIHLWLLLELIAKNTPVLFEISKNLPILFLLAKILLCYLKLAKSPCIFFISKKFPVIFFL